MSKYRVVEKDDGWFYMQVKDFLWFVDVNAPGQPISDYLISLAKMYNKPYEKIVHKIIKVVYP